MYTVLIADDEAIERETVGYLLAQHFPGKFQVEQASNGKEALALLQAKKVDVLLSDIEMPFLSGIELAREARMLYPDIELLFFSGFDDFEYVQSALVLRAVNYVLKPLNLEQFCQAVTDILSRLDSQRIAFAKSPEYYDQTFYRDQAGNEQDKDSRRSDADLLKSIDLSVQLKRPEEVQRLVDELLDRYSDPSGRSHHYIRHIAADLLQIIIGGISTLSAEDFDSAVEEVYTLHYFSDIKRVIKKYLYRLTEDLLLEINGPNHSIHRVKQYIEEHYNEELALNQLADYVYLSPNYLSNMFTKETGCSLSKYIQQVRMNKARELLVRTNMKVADIGKAVGYPTTSYFIKAFQKLYGITPMNYRLEHPPAK